MNQRVVVFGSPDFWDQSSIWFLVEAGYEVVSSWPQSKGLSGTRPEIIICDDVAHEEEMMRQQHIVAGTKKARQLAHSHSGVVRQQVKEDKGIKAKTGWKFITAADGTISKVRA